MYINVKRIKGKVHCGEVNIPYGIEFDVDEQGFIYYIKDGSKKRICWETSERAYKDFAWNDDGRGAERKALINECVDLMSRVHNKDTEFLKFFDDFTSMKYKKSPNDNTEWSWDRFKVHHAPIEDLQHIKDVINTMDVWSKKKIMNEYCK